MASDWIKVEKSTARKPEVLRIADLLQIHPRHAFGLCVEFWFWCDDQMTNGHALSVTNVTLDAAIGHAGMCAALVEVGWLRVRDGSLEVPNFDRHLSESSKKRALSGKRQQKKRTENLSRSERDKSVTRVRVRDCITHTQCASGPRETFLTGPSEAAKRFREAYPRKAKPAEADRQFAGTVAEIVGSRGMTDAEAEEFLIDRAEAFAASPAGMPPPPGQFDDFRPEPANWLKAGRFDEPVSEWQKPNVRGNQNGPSANRRSDGRTPRKSPTERTAETIDIDALFDQIPAKRMEAKPADGIRET